jgi:anthranilate phosphoribosyltransferase
MNAQHTLARIVAHEELPLDGMLALMRQLLRGELDDTLAVALMVALRTRGERIDDIAATAIAARECMVEVPLDAAGSPAVDLCGTGGDGGRSFNVSTAASFVACAAGARVAKHGNRGVSSRCGSADVLQALGVNITPDPAQLAQCLRHVGMAFMFTPNHHPAMLRLAGVRKALGLRTVFNITGPLTNPARVPHQLVGVFEARLAPQLAQVLARLGSRRALIVHGHDGLDEITLSDRTLVAELRDGAVGTYEIGPEDFGFPRAPPDALRADDIEASCRMLLQALSGTAGPAHDVVVLNAGAALYACGVAASLPQGVARAAEAVRSGAALRKLHELVRFSGKFN